VRGAVLRCEEEKGVIMIAAAPLERRRFTAAEVLRMVDAGILAEDEPVELLEGELVVTPPQGPPHAAVVCDLAERLRDVYGPACHVRPQCPLVGAVDSLPEPDLAVVRGKARDYATRHPTGPDVVLVIEVARTSQALDRRKVRAYATIGVSVYWIVDLAARRLEVRSEPTADGEYRVTRLLGENETIALPRLDVSWNVASLLV
jgi:Uma2 family endonuclease